jgi:hypothetical protein
MRYLSSAPFSSPPASDAFKKNYPFGPTKFERELAEEKAHNQLPKSFAELWPICKFRDDAAGTCGFFAHKAECKERCPAFNSAVRLSDFITK